MPKAIPLVPPGAEALGTRIELAETNPLHPAGRPVAVTSAPPQQRRVGPRTLSPTARHPTEAGGCGADTDTLRRNAGERDYRAEVCREAHNSQLS